MLGPQIVRSAAEYFGSPTCVFLTNLVVDISEPAVNSFDRNSDSVGKSSIGQPLPAYTFSEWFVRNHQPSTVPVAVMAFAFAPPRRCHTSPG